MEPNTLAKILQRIIRPAGAGAASIIALLSSGAAVAQDVPPVYIGTISVFALNFCPPDYLPADGTLLQINKNQTLFSLIGTIYGGDGKYTFALPDLKDRGIIGNSKTNPLASTVGSYSVTLGPSQVPLLEHTHTAKFSPTKTPFSVTIPAVTGSLKVVPVIAAKQATGLPLAQNGSFLAQGGVGQSSAPIYAPSSSTASSVELGGVSATVSGTAGTAAVTSSSVEMVTDGTVVVDNVRAKPASQPVITQSPVIALTVCIAVKGYLPLRP